MAPMAGSGSKDIGRAIIISLRIFLRISEEEAVSKGRYSLFLFGSLMEKISIYTIVGQGRILSLLHGLFFVT